MSACAVEAVRPPTPILVVGMNRSGTKWLSNILCNHPDVFGVLSERHGGILETNLFGKMQALIGDLERVEHFVAFVELWSQTDFFGTTGVEKELLYTRKERPREVLDAFRLVMDEAARRCGSRFWLQKTSPSEGWGVLPRFPDARIVTIRRGLVPTLESAAKLRRDRGEADSLAKAAAVYAYEAKVLRRIQRDRDAVHVEYESLGRSTEHEVRRICEAIGLGYRPEMLETRFAANTSFRGGDAPGERLGTARIGAARAVEAALGTLPLPLLATARNLLRSRRALLVTGTFSRIAERYGLR
jgi:hypothetical protein